MFLNLRRFGAYWQPIFKVVCVLLFALALALRIALFPIQTGDYTAFLSQWYDFIQTHGGFSALRFSFSNYNVPYLYLLVIASGLPVSKLIAIKTISILFDVPLCLFTFLLLRLKYRHTVIPWLGAVVIAFAPTLFINSAAWGQADATYTAFCLGCLYFLLSDRPIWACIFFGLALSFKLQAIFFLPVLVLLLVRRRLDVRAFLLVPASFLLMLLPAFIAGRSVLSLLSIYPDQVSSGGVGGNLAQGGGAGGRFRGTFFQGQNGGSGPTFPRSGGFGPGQVGGNGGGRFAGGGSITNNLTFHAPSFYQWLPVNISDNWKWPGIALAGLLVLLVIALVIRSKQQLNHAIIIKATLVFALGLPFLLPDMHERYFYLADVCSILAAFYFPRLFFIAIIMQTCSLLSYAPYLMNRTIISLTYVAGAVLVIFLIALGDLVLTLYPSLQTRLLALMKPDEEVTAPDTASEGKRTERSSDPVY